MQTIVSILAKAFLEKADLQGLFNSNSKRFAVMFIKKNGEITWRCARRIEESDLSGGPDKLAKTPYVPFASVNDNGIRCVSGDNLIAYKQGNRIWLRADAKAKAIEAGLPRKTALYKAIFAEELYG